MKLSFGSMIVGTALLVGTPVLADTDYDHHHHHHHHKDHHHQEASTGSPTTEDLNARSLASVRAGNPPPPEGTMSPGAMPSGTMPPAPAATIPAGTGTVAPPLPPVPTMPDRSSQ